MSKICTYICDYCGHVTSDPAQWATYEHAVPIPFGATQTFDLCFTKHFCGQECLAAWKAKHGIIKFTPHEIKDTVDTTTQHLMWVVPTEFTTYTQPSLLRVRVKQMINMILQLFQRQP